MEQIVLFKTSQGLKAGLAAGVIYGFLIGVLHLITLEACSGAQIDFISQQLLKQIPQTNATAMQLFSTDVVYYPMVYGVWALCYGVIFGVVYALAYDHLPGNNSKRKGLVLSFPVFLISLAAGPGDLLYVCSPSYFPYFSILATLPVSFAFGYILGVFFDSFGRLAEERAQEASRNPA